ncbi:flagellar motor switch protein FliN [Spirochaetota bacterium]|nr:flagellar motor switch protein FliN [Spirochaetota bacterium]
MSDDISEEELKTLMGTDEMNDLNSHDSSDVKVGEAKKDTAGKAATQGGELPSDEDTILSDVDMLDALVSGANNGKDDGVIKAMDGGAKKQVKPASFTQLANKEGVSGDTTNMQLLMDVPMQISVELGRASRTVKEILALNVGSVVELDKLSGEPVDLLVNGRIIAKAEVVIIDENFGIRITEITQPQDRLVLE